MDTRRTLRTPVDVAGVGLHSGAPARATLTPAASGAGVLFVRADLPGAPAIPATPRHVMRAERRTVLALNRARVDTVEHVMAALAAFEIDDVVIELDGPEMPIGDGSAQPFVEALDRAGIAEQPGEPAAVRLEAPIRVWHGGATYAAQPAETLRLRVTIEWDHPLIGRQQCDVRVTADGFARELARARTFGFLRDAEGLLARGLARGASADNTVVLSDDALFGTTLRWPDEFARHKALDLLGDLALVGGRLGADVTAVRPSHEGNIMLARAIDRLAIRRGATRHGYTGDHANLTAPLSATVGGSHRGEGAR